MNNFIVFLSFSFLTHLILNHAKYLDLDNNLQSFLENKQNLFTITDILERFIMRQKFELHDKSSQNRDIEELNKFIAREDLEVSKDQIQETEFDEYEYSD